MTEPFKITHPLHALWVFYIPLAALTAQICLEIFLPQPTLAVLMSESGPHEMLQFLCAAAAALIALRILMSIPHNSNAALYTWISCFFIGCVYIAGEEISWGQHVLNWDTPEYWAGLNDQGETNLHNTTSWLDQKPRLILEIGVLTGGLVLPALMRFRPQWVPQKFVLIYPPVRLWLIALVVLGVTITEKVGKALPGVTLMERPSEIDELYLFYFVLLYLLILRKRITG